MSDASYWDVIEPHWDAFCDGLTGRTQASDVIAALPAGVGLLAAAHLCQSEVRNGGFHQYFFNTSGKVAEAALAGYELIGMTEVAGATSVAMARLGAPYPAARGARQKRLAETRATALAALDSKPDSFWSPFDDEEDVFYARIDDENGGFDAAATAYCRAQGLL